MASFFQAPHLYEPALIPDNGFSVCRSTLSDCSTHVNRHKTAVQGVDWLPAVLPDNLLLSDNANGQNCSAFVFVQNLCGGKVYC